MNLPRKLKAMNVFGDGQSFLGETNEVVLPKLTRQLESMRSGGMSRSLKSDQGGGDLEIEVTYGGFMRQILARYGEAQVDGVMLRFAGAYQNDGTGQVDAVEVVTRGRYEEIDMGTAKAGEDTEFKTKSPLAYYKLSVNGQVLVEIDVLNMIEIVNGVDILAAQRAAIGA